MNRSNCREKVKCRKGVQGMKEERSEEKNKEVRR